MLKFHTQLIFTLLLCENSNVKNGKRMTVSKFSTPRNVWLSCVQDLEAEISVLSYNNFNYPFAIRC